MRRRSLNIVECADSIKFTSCLAALTIGGRIICLCDYLLSTILSRSASISAKEVSQCRCWCSLVVSPVLAGAILTATTPDLQWKRSSESFCSQIHTILVFTYDHAHYNAIVGGHARSNRGSILNLWSACATIRATILVSMIFNW